jgi:hypothetical protein
MTSAAREQRARLVGASERDLGTERLHTLIEVAFLAAAADGELADAEIHHLAATLEDYLEAPLDSATLVKLFEHLSALRTQDGVDARLAAAAAALEPQSRRVAYRLACITTLCDLEVHDDELGFLGTVAQAFDIPLDEAQATFDELDDAVTALSTQ